MKSRIIIVFMIIIIIVVGYFFMKVPFTHEGSLKESFTPSLKKIYRPYIRRGRVHATKVYDSFTKKSHNFFKKIGFI